MVSEMQQTKTLTELKRGLRGHLIVPLLSLMLVLTVFGVLSPTRFLSLTNVQVILTQTAVLSVVGFGLTLVIIAGYIDLSIGSIAAVAGIVAAQLAMKWGPIQGLVVALVLALLCGLINGLVFTYLKMPSFLVTLAMLTSARGLAYLISNGESFVVHKVPVLGYVGIYPTVVLVAGALLAVIWFVLNRTPTGLYYRTLGGSERVADLVGLPLVRLKLSLFAISGVLAGLTGLILASRQGAATPNLGTGLELDVISTVVVGGTPLTGGVGDVTNTVIGAVVISALSNGLVILGLHSDVQMIIKGIVLVIAVLVSLDRSKIGIIK